jgi:hypothetical protein
MYVCHKTSTDDNIRKNFDTMMVFGCDCSVSLKGASPGPLQTQQLPVAKQPPPEPVIGRPVAIGQINNIVFKTPKNYVAAVQPTAFHER